MPDLREVLFAPEVLEKLWVMHGLTQWDVEEVIFDPDSEPRWDIDPEQGGRVIVRGMTAGVQPRLIFVALRPVDLPRGVWACITAFTPTDPDYGS